MVGRTLKLYFLPNTGNEKGRISGPYLILNQVGLYQEAYREHPFPGLPAVHLSVLWRELPDQKQNVLSRAQTAQKQSGGGLKKMYPDQDDVLRYRGDSTLYIFTENN